MSLKRCFFLRPTLQVAKELLGKRMIFYDKSAIITETEAYIGTDDPACHASRGLTKRTEVMFRRGGYSYVYLIYGMYHCLNFVTEDAGFPAAVLIRGLLTDNNEHFDGPGKLCRAFGITKDHNKIDITENPDFYLVDENINFSFKTTPRIGISKGQDKLWRFVADVKNKSNIAK